MRWSSGRRSTRRWMSAIVIVLVSCSTAERSAEPRDPDGTTPISPVPSPSPFVSERHAYRLEVPPGWEVTEYGGTWTRLGQFHPGEEVVGEDVVLSPDGAAFLVANSMEIPDGMTPSEWLAAFDRLVTSGLDPGCPGTEDRGTLAGEPAIIIEQQCDGMKIVGQSLTHEGRGYYFTIGVPAEDRATEATLDGILASIRFGPA
jgi:hypothetical protein